MSSRLVLGLAALAVIALLIGLWAMIDLSSAEPTPPPRKAAPVAAVKPAGDPWSAPVREPALPRTQVKLPVPSATPPGAPPTPTLEVPTGAADPKLERAESMRRWLKRQIFASEQALIDCVGANKVDGYVSFGFKLSKKGEKVVVEALPPDANTFADPAIVECMRTATQAMTYDELPEGVQSVSSYRKIVVEKGALVENWLGGHETVPPGLY